jgi:hypothetical protein
MATLAATVQGPAAGMGGALVLRQIAGSTGCGQSESFQAARGVRLLALDELKEVCVYFAGIDDRNSVGASGIHFQDRVRND